MFPDGLRLYIYNTHKINSQNYTRSWKTYIVLRMMEALVLTSLVANLSIGAGKN